MARSPGAQVSKPTSVSATERQGVPVNPESPTNMGWKSFGNSDDHSPQVQAETAKGS
jgi:hypothetical protein